MRSMKRLTVFLAAALIALPAVNTYSYKFDFTTVSDIVKKVKDTFGKLESYEAEFNISTTRIGKTQTQNGVIKYKNSDRLLIEFYKPSGQKIVSNGKSMWIYIPGMNVVAEQDLKADTGLFSAGTKSGLNRLFAKYHYRFASKDQPESMPDGKKYYTMILKQKESRSGFRNLKLWITEDYFIKKAEGDTSTGKKIEISFNNIKTNGDLPNGIFKFDVPARARVIKNPMIAEE